ncbi:hypothetical protein [Pseudomonas syringae]|uniref:hypothetical protein n=1 Tax=Pseudomonas syringae TaxID=317 RepID=UPI000E30D01D|nr:hypothetical protein [Pseudomonas syringae]
MSVSGISDWINVGGQVVDLASNIANLFGEEKEDSAPSTFDLGLLSFGVSDGAIYVANPSQSNNVLLNFCQTQQQGLQSSTTSSPIVVNANSGIDITDIVNGYQGGGSFLIRLAETQNPTDDPVVQAIAFAIKILAVGTTIAIIGGVTGSFGKNPQDGTWSFSIRSTGPKISGGSLTLTDQNAMTLSAAINFSQSQGGEGVGDSIGQAVFPAGFNLSPSISDVQINLTAESQYAEFLELKSVPLSEIPAFKHLKLV